MKRTVNRDFIDAWINERYPNALAKLSAESDVPANSIAKIRLGYVPKSEEKRQRLAKVLGVKERELFPLSPDKEKAS